MNPRPALITHADTLRDDAARLDTIAVELADLAESLQQEEATGPSFPLYVREQSARARLAASDLREAAALLVPSRRRLPGIPAFPVLSLLMTALANRKRTSPTNH